MDGQTFLPLERVPGHGTTLLPQAYSLRDASVAHYGAALLYYRLHQVDTDGRGRCYSAVRTVAVAAGSPGTTAFPNPYTQLLTVQVQTPAAGPVQLVLRDVLGRECLHQTANLAEAGSHAIALDGAGGLPAGIYLLTITLTGQTVQLRMSHQ